MPANQSFRHELSILLSESRSALGSISHQAPPQVVEQALVQIQNHFNNTMNQVKAELSDAATSHTPIEDEDELVAEEDDYPED